MNENLLTIAHALLNAEMQKRAAFLRGIVQAGRLGQKANKMKRLKSVLDRFRLQKYFPNPYKSPNLTLNVSPTGKLSARNLTATGSVGGQTDYLNGITTLTDNTSRFL